MSTKNIDFDDKKKKVTFTKKNKSILMILMSIKY